MSRRLAELINEVVVKEGGAGRLRLALAAGRGEQSIDRYRKGACTPSQNTAYKLALACGCTDGEALELAKECFPVRARETA